ncbi:hypothetical protein [Chromobacterium subtsugae]|uniref:hypothetical protein n=1 Tax=Chromobacterium subtsugae TaxID=251747 RepID=UPI0006417A69|nr:hypothetical protein [Chromobacterium subtsugae]
MKIHHVGDHAAARRQQYPDIGDQLDALWRVVASLPPGQLPPQAAQVLEQIRQVKHTYPKPRDSGACALEA